MTNTIEQTARCITLLSSLLDVKQDECRTSIFQHPLFQHQSATYHTINSQSSLCLNDYNLIGTDELLNYVPDTNLTKTQCYSPSPDKSTKNPALHSPVHEIKQNIAEKTIDAKREIEQQRSDSSPKSINQKADGCAKSLNKSPNSEKRCYKTELCKRYLTSESLTCEYGEKCQFAHGVNELRLPPRHPRYKTEICHAFHNYGVCPYGRRCAFIHNESFQRLAMIRCQNNLYHEYRKRHPDATDVRIFDLISSTTNRLYKPTMGGSDIHGVSGTSSMRRVTIDFDVPEKRHPSEEDENGDEDNIGPIELQSIISRLRSFSLPSESSV